MAACSLIAQRRRTLKVIPKFKAYSIIESAVSEGIARGYRRAHKHTDAPGEEHILESIRSAVMGELEEVLDYDRSSAVEKDPP